MVHFSTMNYVVVIILFVFSYYTFTRDVDNDDTRSVVKSQGNAREFYSAWRAITVLIMLFRSFSGFSAIKYFLYVTCLPAAVASIKCLHIEYISSNRII